MIQATLWDDGDMSAVEGPGATPRVPEALLPGRDRVLYDMGRRDGIACALSEIACLSEVATEEQARPLVALRVLLEERHQKWAGVVAAGLAAVLAAEVTR